MPQYALGRLDRYVVTGYGESGSITSGSKILANTDGRLVTLDCEILELLLIFAPDKTFAMINRSVEYLYYGGFRLEHLDHVVVCDNDYLKDTVKSHCANENLFFVYDVPIYPLTREIIWIGGTLSEAPAL